MADQELATKAPENDAMEAIPIPGDTPAQVGPSMELGEHCVTDRPTPFGVGPSGEITQLGGIDVYISKPSDYPHLPSKLLLFLTGATGLHAENNQIQADKFATEGFVTIMPDMFSDDPLPGSMTYNESNDPSVIEQIKMRVAETGKSFLIDMWLARQTPEKVLPIIQKVIEAVKDEFADAVANGGGLYSVGYCFGGRMTLLLASEKADAQPIAHNITQNLPNIPFISQPAPPPSSDIEAGLVKKGPYIKAGAIAHATLVTKDDFIGTQVPLSFVCVENDQLFPDDVKTHGEQFLNTNGVENEFKTYDGVPHGFATFGDYGDEKIKGRQVEAFEQMLAWLKNH
ncbi:dienelactone hydrolase family protein-like protein [Calycina marina]|uniref:Dienelactone hydrolase family protein-like protein n=1 Tax=Calycina marina TaxID=1763456 RepID=A0A9P8CF61_9HELO|nr:dienelactone hydrolase family protein-like protein [Calycina marina]